MGLGACYLFRKFAWGGGIPGKTLALVFRVSRFDDLTSEIHTSPQAEMKAGFQRRRLVQYDNFPTTSRPW
jgi:hypothetical protein